MHYWVDILTPVDIAKGFYCPLCKWERLCEGVLLPTMGIYCGCRSFGGIFSIMNETNMFVVGDTVCATSAVTPPEIFYIWGLMSFFNRDNAALAKIVRLTSRTCISNPLYGISACWYNPMWTDIPVQRGAVDSDRQMASRGVVRALPRGRAVRADPVSEG